MKISHYLLIAILIFTTKAFSQQQVQTSQVIIKFKQQFILAKPDLKNKHTGNILIDKVIEQDNALSVKKLYTGKKSTQLLYIIEFPEGTDVQKIITDFNNTGIVEYAEPDYKGKGSGTQGITPNDTYFSRQWSLNNNGSFSLSPATAGADISMENAWAIEEGDTNVIVGIVDSGCKLDHPEFAGRIWVNRAEIPANGVDDDGNGFIDDMNGWNFAYNNNNPKDDYGHGTNVTGIIGATGNNGSAYAGMDWHCKLMIVKGLDSADFGYYSWWAQGVYYAVDNGAKVINISLEGTSSSTTLQSAMDYADTNNVLVVVCMGNENSSSPDYPAACTHVMAVGATNPNDTRVNPFFWSTTSGSNYGSYISVVAPGNYIYGLNYLSNTNYNTYWGGTSQATPHVAGLAALLVAQDTSRTADQVRSIIENTAIDQVGLASEDTPGWDQYFGHGRINAYKALSAQTTTAIKENSSQNLLCNIYPNPNNGNFIFETNSKVKQTVELHDLNGRLVLSQTTNGNTSINANNLSEGIYNLRIVSSENIINRKLVIVK